MSAALRSFACPGCSTRVTTVLARQVTCGAQRCRERRRAASPERVAQSRARFRRWREAKLGAPAKPQPWLLGAPPYGSHLPGAGLVLSVAPHPPWAVEHRHVRALHGLVSTILNEGHSAELPLFSLVPWACPFGWALYLRDLEVARLLAGQSFRQRLGEHAVVVSLGSVMRIRTPRIGRRGRQRLLVEAITPVVMRTHGGRELHTAPTETLLCGSLTGSFRGRLGVEVAREQVVVEVVRQETTPETVVVGGKFGVVRGWVGRVEVETNAVGRWLLECAARIGLGGRTALGFGRVAVSEVG